jgi:hypothetical protein
VLLVKKLPDHKSLASCPPVSCSAWFLANSARSGNSIIGHVPGIFRVLIEHFGFNHDGGNSAMHKSSPIDQTLCSPLRVGNT